MKITKKIVKNGNSAGVNLPAHLLEALGKKVGDYITIEINEEEQNENKGE